MGRLGRNFPHPKTTFQPVISCTPEGHHRRPSKNGALYKPPYKNTSRQKRSDFEGDRQKQTIIIIDSNLLILSIYLRSASWSAPRQSEALPLRETQGVLLRERKETLGSPVSKVDRVEGGIWFQSTGPLIAKARV